MDRKKAFYEEMQEVKELLLKKEIPDRYPESIEKIRQDPYKNDYYVNRFDFINISSFALISKKWVVPLAEYISANKCLEVMAGKGVLSKSLYDCGVNIKATDNYTWKWHRSGQNKGGQRLSLDELWFGVENMDCIEAIIKYGANMDFIICCWPPYQSDALYHALIKMRDINPKCRLIYIGEGKGGCNAENRFFNEAVYINDDERFNDITRRFQKWAAIYDKISLIK